MQSPVGVGDGVNFQQSGGSALFDQAWQTRQKPLAFNAAVNDDRPAFNAQLAVDTATLIITGVELINSGSDMNQMLPMHEHHQERYARVPQEWLADGGFAKHGHIEQLEARATKVFAPMRICATAACNALMCAA